MFRAKWFAVHVAAEMGRDGEEQVIAKIAKGLRYGSGAKYKAPIGRFMAKQRVELRDRLEKAFTENVVLYLGDLHYSRDVGGKRRRVVVDVDAEEVEPMTSQYLSMLNATEGDIRSDPASNPVTGEPLFEMRTDAGEVIQVTIDSLFEGYWKETEGFGSEEGSDQGSEGGFANNGFEHLDRDGYSDSSDGNGGMFVDDGDGGGGSSRGGEDDTNQAATHSDQGAAEETDGSKGGKEVSKDTGTGWFSSARSSWLGSLFTKVRRLVVPDNQLAGGRGGGRGGPPSIGISADNLGGESSDGDGHYSGSGGDSGRGQCDDQREDEDGGEGGEGDGHDGDSGEGQCDGLREDGEGGEGGEGDGHDGDSDSGGDSGRGQCDDQREDEEGGEGGEGDGHDGDSGEGQCDGLREDGGSDSQREEHEQEHASVRKRGIFGLSKEARGGAEAREAAKEKEEEEEKRARDTKQQSDDDEWRQFEEAGGHEVIACVKSGKYRGPLTDRELSIHFRSPANIFFPRRVIFPGNVMDDAQYLSLRFMQTHGYELMETYGKPISFFVGEHVQDGWRNLVSQPESGRSNSPSRHTSRSLTQAARPPVLRKRARVQGAKPEVKRRR